VRILHTADIHLGELSGPVVNGLNARMMDTVRCMDFVVETAKKEDIDAILIAGDLFHKSKLWADEMLKEIGIAADWLRRLAGIAPTILLFGTANHDNLEAFNNIRKMSIPNLLIITHPMVARINTNSGPLQIAAVPGFDKGYFRSKYPGMSAEEENVKCSQLLGDIILGLGAQIDPLIPSVLISHYTVVGCELDNGEHVFLQNDIVLPKEALAASPFNLVCLGHIHKAQEVPHCGRPVFYCGAINGITFNEEGQDKGFWIHEIGTIEGEECAEVPQYYNSVFIKTPSREFLTINLDLRDSTDIQKDIDWQLAGIGDQGVLAVHDATGKIVRVHYLCTDEQKKQISHKAMEQALQKAGAFYVAEIKPAQIVTTLQKQEMNESADPLENLAAWLLADGVTAEETAALIELARPLVAMVSAKMPTGKLSGVFIPKRIEVKNYRSYREESFDFSHINFATVNGPNGVGKSALFMDAICDCLYEEPREGDLTGWISSDESVRSGSITFEFVMGQTEWRVTRTRAKSGKTTLALAEKVNDEWLDRSCDKTKDTQEKIIALLGMDAMTFRCCALIMQDAYGLFMEADKADRMEVLGNILGLNIYEQLNELARNKVTEVNRELSKARDKLAELDERLNAKEGLQAELADVNSSLTVVAHDLRERESALKEAEELVRQLTAKKEKAEDLQRQIEALAGEIATKQQEKYKQQEQLDKAQTKLSYEAQIMEKSAEYERVKEQVTVLKAKQPQLEQLKKEVSRLAVDISNSELNIKKLGEQIGVIETVLSNKDELQKAAQEYRDAVTDLEAMDKLGQTYQEYREKILTAEAETDRTGEDWDKQRQLIKSLKDKANMLCDKAAMLKNSNCVDPENAKCAFLADAQKAKAEIPVVETEIAEAEAELVRIEKEREPLLKIVANLEAEQEALNYDHQKHYDLRQRVNELRPKAEQAAELSGKAELLQSLIGQRTQFIEQKHQLLKRQTELDDQVKALTEELKPLAEMEARLPKLEQWVKAKEELPAARQIIAAATEQIATIEREIAAKEQQRKALHDERADLLAAVIHLQPETDTADILRRQIRDLRDRQNELHASAGGLKAKLEALQKDEEERKRIATEMEPLAKEVTRYQTLARAFGFDGIPFSIVRSVVPELSAMANEVLGQMTGGKMSLEMRTERVQKSNKKEVNALEIWITDYQRGTLPYKSRSGGQKVKAALSVAFALADLKARRAGIQLGMLFIDEPPFLDGEGTEAYCDALELVSQRYPNMIVLAISHDPRMKARFPQQIDVLDTEEGSKVRQVA